MDHRALSATPEILLPSFPTVYYRNLTTTSEPAEANSYQPYISRLRLGHPSGHFRRPQICVHFSSMNLFKSDASFTVF